MLSNREYLLRRLPKSAVGRSDAAASPSDIGQSKEEERWMSRFIRLSDEQLPDIIYTLPKDWWSRPYEYAWASQFANASDTVLDVACGVCHPFKFYLGMKTRFAFGCDGDVRILSRESILDDIADSVGEEARSGFDLSLFDTVQLTQCDMTSMPYEDKMFDKVFCISVLEHVGEQAQREALREFARVLKDDGLAVLTFDYPTVDLEQLRIAFTEAGLQIAGTYDMNLPSDAVASRRWGLN